jgi:hypothetical protein
MGEGQARTDCEFWTKRKHPQLQAHLEENGAFFYLSRAPKPLRFIFFFEYIGGEQSAQVDLMD